MVPDAKTGFLRPAGQASPTFLALFTPKLVTILRAGYGAADLKADILAGLTVAVVALPLSMAIAIASGVGPERGLYTAIVGGFLVSLLGGSRFQVGGPAGAFIVLVAACVHRNGIDGLLLAVILSGVILAAAGFLRLGTYIKFIPYPVTVGFTAGIAAIIFASQISDLFGLAIAGHEPADLLPKLGAIAAALPTLSLGALGLSVLTIAAILLLHRYRPHWPAMLIALALASAVAALLHLDAATIGSRFGGIPASLPVPSLPAISAAKLVAILPDAFAFALLGAIESLLSATVADGMTGRRHRSNCELVAQGVANIASGLFGGIAVTGTVARTATNVRAGARGPVAGMAHALFLLLFMLVAAPLARFVPLAALSGVLAVVAWNMIDRRAFTALLSASRGDAAVLLGTLLLTIVRDVTTGIVFGFAAGTLLFLARMAGSVGIEGGALVREDTPDEAPGTRKRYDPRVDADPEHAVFRISGPFFFGAASTVAGVLDSIAGKPKTFVLDFAAVPFLDSTAAVTVAAFARKTAKDGVPLTISGANASVRAMLAAHGVRPPAVRFAGSVDAALEKTPLPLAAE